MEKKTVILLEDGSSYRDFSIGCIDDERYIVFPAKNMSDAEELLCKCRNVKVVIADLNLALSTKVLTDHERNIAVDSTLAGWIWICGCIFNAFEIDDVSLKENRASLATERADIKIIVFSEYIDNLEKHIRDNATNEERTVFRDNLNLRLHLLRKSVFNYDTSSINNLLHRVLS